MQADAHPPHKPLRDTHYGSRHTNSAEACPCKPTNLPTTSPCVARTIVAETSIQQKPVHASRRISSLQAPA